MNREQLKTSAKTQLGGGIFKSPWLMALLYLVVATAITSASSIVLVGPIIVMGPIAYAQCKAFLRVARGEAANYDLGTLFDGFKDDFGQNLLLGLMTSIFVCLWSMLFVIPGIIKMYAYSMAFYVKADHPDYDWHQCLNESKRLTDGHKGELFVLDLSFIGWLIVGSLACGLGTLWVTPYQFATKTNAYLYLLSATPAQAIPVQPEA